MSGKGGLVLWCLVGREKLVCGHFWLWNGVLLTAVQVFESW